MQSGAMKARLAFALAGSSILGVAAISAAGAAASTRPPVSATTDNVAGKLASAFLANHCRVGLSIATIAHGRARFYDYGKASLRIRRKPTADSIYEIASVTKTFTGALAAQAVSDGVMRVDQDFRVYLPQSYPNLQRDGKPITLRTLATHRSGLPRDLPDTDALYANRDFRTFPETLLALDHGYDRNRYLTALHDTTLKSTPGTTETYSNLGMKVLGFGLETVRRQPFEQLMRNAILQPLGMMDTGFELSAGQRKRLVTAYDRLGRAVPYHLRNAGAAWGLYSTPADMLKYVRWQLDETVPAIRLAHQPLVGTLADGEGLIWNMALDNGERMLWHGGGTFGMSAQIVLYPQTHEGYVLLSNDACEGTEGALKEIAQQLHAASNG
jgi:CubicO group peptidase (beta-lactamase class C family)